MLRSTAIMYSQISHSCFHTKILHFITAFHALSFNIFSVLLSPVSGWNTWFGYSFHLFRPSTTFSIVSFRTTFALFFVFYNCLLFTMLFLRIALCASILYTIASSTSITHFYHFHRFYSHYSIHFVIALPFVPIYAMFFLFFSHLMTSWSIFNCPTNVESQLQPIQLYFLSYSFFFFFFHVKKKFVHFKCCFSHCTGKNYHFCRVFHLAFINQLSRSNQYE